ncbi:MAG: RpiB/LacA/LacB family sugar-phosphate isomerase [Spirochaetaceae bacterium]|jgi:ribose 5-phosphate isomerase RpiB|nr:RpiB/LacA/LacB family sugar-phosphate isomerase [Spirochaetaceae bacterium]
MKIAVIIEGSTKHRNGEVVKALEALGQGHEIYNLGMKNVEGEPDLTYMETGFMTALILNLKAVDFVVGGCGTGQGYINAVLQFPGTACGLLVDSVDSFLFSQVNAGNCISLSLNKGYGNLGGDLNLRYIFQNLFNDTYGQGYPPARKDIQMGARKRLAQLSLDAHKSMREIIACMDKQSVSRALSFPGVFDFIKTAPPSELKDYVLSLVK